MSPKKLKPTDVPGKLYRFGCVFSEFFSKTLSIGISFVGIGALRAEMFIFKAQMRVLLQARVLTFWPIHGWLDTAVVLYCRFVLLRSMKLFAITKELA